MKNKLLKATASAGYLFNVCMGLFAVVKMIADLDFENDTVWIMSLLIFLPILVMQLAPSVISFALFLIYLGMMKKGQKSKTKVIVLAGFFAGMMSSLMSIVSFKFAYMPAWLTTEAVIFLIYALLDRFAPEDDENNDDRLQG